MRPIRMTNASKAIRSDSLPTPGSNCAETSLHISISSWVRCAGGSPIGFVRDTSGSSGRLRLGFCINEPLTSKIAVGVGGLLIGSPVVNMLGTLGVITAADSTCLIAVAEWLDV